MKSMGRRGFLIAGGTVLAGGAAAFALLEPAVSGPGTSTASDAGTLAALGKEPPHGEKWIGAEDAPVTVYEFASATCPHCANFHKATYPALKKEFIDTGKIKFVLREFPLDDLSLAAFMVARCAPEGRYFDMIHVLFERQRVWTGHDPRGELFKIARQAGATEESFEKCLSDEKVARGILAVREHAQTVLGVSSTPTFFINGMKLTGNHPLSSFRKHIEHFTESQPS